MKECWVTEPLHFEMRETEIPEPKDNEVQIKMMAAGVCGSDIHIYKGENPNSRYPLIPGHENVGLVTKVGADCKNIKVGDHVVIDYVIRCGECYQCKHGRGNVCEHVLVRGSGTNGGWREYWCVEEPYVYKIDDSIPWKDAALIEPLTSANTAPAVQACARMMWCSFWAPAPSVPSLHRPASSRALKPSSAATSATAVWSAASSSVPITP